uniref:Uncharacterized protein n=1 Tax=Timema monikensis TaxID=170555 RepID=A0A7R9HJZ9_9NEOP|nr:unnamed protein product [Timema monikensis]
MKNSSKYNTDFLIVTMFTNMIKDKTPKVENYKIIFMFNISKLLSLKTNKSSLNIRECSGNKIYFFC